MTAKVIDLAPTIVPGCNWKKEVRLPRLAAALAYRNRELVQSPASLALECISKVTVYPFEWYLEWYEMIDLTLICPMEASGRCLRLEYDGLASECLFGHNLRLRGVDTSQALGITSQENRKEHDWSGAQVRYSLHASTFCSLSFRHQREYQTCFPGKAKGLGFRSEGYQPGSGGGGGTMSLSFLESENREYALHGKSSRIHAELLHVTSQILPC